MNALLKTKTFWAGIVAIVTAVGCYFTGEISLADMIQTIVTGAIGITLRDSIAKKQAD